MSPLSIIEHFDIIKDIFAGQFSGFIDAFLDALLFQATKKRFGYCIVPTITSSTHAWLKIVLSAKAQPIITAVL
jgi:hypothetical protein